MTKVYSSGARAVAALDEIAIVFSSRQFTAVMDASGSGKTTLLQVAAGIERLTSGQVRIRAPALHVMGWEDLVAGAIAASFAAAAESSSQGPALISGDPECLRRPSRTPLVASFGRVNEPIASRPYMPGYGMVPAGEGCGLLPWSWAKERLVRSHDFWLATVTPEGVPHLMPVWAVWHEGRL